jgi:general secretion pathway protein D
LGNISKPLPSGYSVQLVPLKFIGVREMAKILEPFAPEAGAIRADELRNMLILAGGEKELRHLMETIDIFDVDWMSGMSVGLFPLHSTDVKTLYGEIDKLFGDKSQSPLAGVVRLVPIERLNALLVITPQPKYLEQARLWIERLDRVSGNGGGAQLFVYPVQNGKAERLASLLGNIFSKQGAAGKTTPAASLAPGLEPAEIGSTSQTGMGQAVTPQKNSPLSSTAGDTQFSSSDGSLKVIADKDNNALLILTTPDQYEKIESALKKLDVIPRQVLIEVTIAEVTLTGNLKYGVEWYFNNSHNQSGQLDTGGTGIAALVPGFSYTWKDSTGSIKAVLNALATDSRLNVISSPHLMVMDNQTAKIQVGDRVPAGGSQTVVGTNVVNSIQYLDTGVQLNVTPRINAGGMVAMDITQEVSSATATTSSNIDSPTISKRSIHSLVAVQSGETMVLGGLITDNKTRSSSGIPFLSQVPVLGALFGTQSDLNNRTELLVMITPRVVSNQQQSQEVTAEIRAGMKGLEQMELKPLAGSGSASK